jgi:hypothetical protein
MNRSTLALAIVCAAAIGCAAGAVATSRVVPPARAGSNPQKWEMTCVEENNARKLKDWGNKAGDQGWELAAASTPIDVGRVEATSSGLSLSMRQSASTNAAGSVSASVLEELAEGGDELFEFGLAELVKLRLRRLILPQSRPRLWSASCFCPNGRAFSVVH